MPRTKRFAPGGMVFHALNRGVGRMKIFWSERDYLAFEETVQETLRFYPMQILAYCWLPNHIGILSCGRRRMTSSRRNWVKQVNQPQSDGELAALRRCLERGSPFGDNAWTVRTAQALGLTSTLRPRGRPRRELEG